MSLVWNHRSNNLLLSLIWVLISYVSLLDASSETGWTLDSDSASCSGAFVLDSLSVSCANNDGACIMGEQVTLEGQLTSQAYLPQSANITGQACVLWYICYSFDMGLSNDICSMLTSVDGTSACPDAGSYSFSKTLTSPGSSSWELPSWLQGYSFTVTLNIVEDDGMSEDTLCVAKIKTASTSSSSSAAAAAVAVSLVAAVSWVSMSIWRKKQRRILLNNDITTNLEGDSMTKKASLLELATQSRHMV